MRPIPIPIAVLALCLLTPTFADAKRKADQSPAGEAQSKDLLAPETYSGLKLRSIGPALMSGRISDLAVHPEHRATIYVAAASGGVWG